MPHQGREASNMNTLKQIAWGLVKPVVKDWLQQRALAIPAAKKAEIAAKLGTTPEMVTLINQELAAQAVAEFDKFKP